MALSVTLNGAKRDFEALPDSVSFLNLMSELGLKADRVAAEHNGEIIPRSSWGEVTVASGDKLEIVHFVGGGV